jgi:hypothetical protein
MSTILTDEVLQDDLVVDLARAVAAANKQARALGVDVSQSLITITQRFDNGPYWRVNYGAKEYVGRRGGDLLVEVDAADATVKRTLRGQ